jgi:hypothetical protein
MWENPVSERKNVRQLHVDVGYTTLAELVITRHRATCTDLNDVHVVASEVYLPMQGSPSCVCIVRQRYIIDMKT